MRPLTPMPLGPHRADAVLCAIGLLLVGCSTKGAGTVGGAGGTLPSGGTGGASAGTGGSASTNAATSGVGVATGGVPGSGGRRTDATATGGAPGDGGTLTGGAAGSGGSRTGGVASSGGVGTGGARTGGSQPGMGGAGATGGASNGGADARTSGDAPQTDTGGGSDRCDVGVYDAASPPKVLALSGSLGCHDPSSIAVEGTTDYLFCTGLGAETSTNLTTWRSASKPFGVPAWLSAAISGVTDLWAPDLSQVGGRYHLYYAGSTFGANKSCIGHATRDSLATGSWNDDGAATICSNVGTSDNWNAIDPNLIVDTDGNPWLTFGSFWSGIKVIALDGQGKRLGATVTAIAARPSNGGALEAPFMVRRCGYYYLFTSWDTCCKGADSTYNIRVVRGTSVTGPFVDKAGTAALQGGGTLIAQGDATFAGPGGQSVTFDGNQAYLVYHAYAKSNDATTLRVAELVWDADGWPVPVGP